MNQLSYGQKINLPNGIVRSVSFDKIRQGSLSRSSQLKLNKEAKVSAVCQKIMNKKLLGDQASPTKKPLGNITAQNNQQSKTSLLKKLLDVKEMSECTFKPKVNKSSQPQRTIEQFLNNQLSYEQKKQDKVVEMRQMILKKIDKENTFQPSLISNNKTDDSKRTLNNVHNRLYEETTKRQESKESSIQQKNNEKRNQSTTQRKIATFSRKGSTQRSGQQNSLVSQKHNQLSCDPSQFNFSIPNVEQSSKHMTDSEDAPSSRRESSRTSSSKNHKGLKVTKFMDVQQICERKLSKKKCDEKQQKKCNKNKQILIKKVLRQINYIIIELSITSQNLTYIQMSQILQKMNFVDEQANLNDRKYLFQIWQMLQGDIYEICPLQNLVKIIFSLLGCNEFQLIQQGFQQFFGESEKGKKLMLNQKQSKTIKINFEELTLNRLNKGQYNQNSLKHKQFSFKPFVSKNSTQMAQKYRQRILEKGSDLINKNIIEYQFAQNKTIDHVDLLLLDDKLKQLKIKNKRQQIQKQKIKIQYQTMNAQKNKKRKSLGVQLYQQMGNQKRQYLYQLGKHTIRLKNDKNNQLLQSILPKQCTFHPKISKSKSNSSKTSKQNSITIHQPDQIKDYDKSIYRMYEGRRFREQPQQKKHQTDLNISNKSKNDDSPLLYLNINMQDCNDIKIPVFQCDNLKTITQKVRTIMQLDEIDDERLSQTLKAQILPALEELGLC